MKRLIIYSIIAMGAFIWQNANSQIMLQKAVVSNAGGTASNGTMNLNYTVGQTATGVASNGQTVGHFGFWTSNAPASSVTASGAGSINSLSLSPNPASNEVSIRISSANQGNMDLLLYDASGHLVQTIFSGKREAGNFIQHFDTRSLSSGTYFVAARVPGALVQTKLNVVK
jgi:hypothetical protein